jgi:hypothetical protein
MNACELFNSIGEPFAAGLFEFPDEAPIIRYSNALKRFWEIAEMPPYDGGMLYPCGVNPFNYNRKMTVRPHYSNTVQMAYRPLKAKNEQAYVFMLEELNKVKSFNDSPHTVGGHGWTHSFPNYTRVLEEGLDEYANRVNALPDGDFKRGMLILLEGIDIYHARCVNHLKEINAPMLSVKQVSLTIDDVFYSLTDKDKKRIAEISEKPETEKKQIRIFGGKRR